MRRSLGMLGSGLLWASKGRRGESAQIPPSTSGTQGVKHSDNPSPMPPKRGSDTRTKGKDGADTDLQQSSRTTGTVDS